MRSLVAAYFLAGAAEVVDTPWISRQPLDYQKYKSQLVIYCFQSLANFPVALSFSHETVAKAFLEGTSGSKGQVEFWQKTIWMQEILAVKNTTETMVENRTWKKKLCKCKYMNFLYLKSLFITWMVYLDPTYCPAPSWLVSSVGRVLHRCRRGHSNPVLAWKITFFRSYFQPLVSVVFLAARISYIRFFTAVQIYVFHISKITINEKALLVKTIDRYIRNVNTCRTQYCGNAEQKREEDVQ